MHDPSSLVLTGQVAPGHTIEELEAGIEEVLLKIQDLQEEDLERLKSKLEAAMVMQRTTLLNKAIALAMADASGDVDRVNQLIDIYRSITLDEVKAYAKEILQPHRCSTLYYLPE